MLDWRSPGLGDTRGRRATSESQQRYKIGVCDWMMLKRQKLGAFPLAKEVGADGVEVDMGSLGQRDSFENALADPAVRKQFLGRGPRKWIGDLLAGDVGVLRTVVCRTADRAANA